MLMVAGEDSGDRLGVQVVHAARALGWHVRGAGGWRMEQAGLIPLVPYEDLAVCGIGDVLGRFPRLHRHLQTLLRALEHRDCRGLVCVDYPGFNLRLQRRAEALRLPVWYVAPPQIWAWKPQRGQLFSRRDVAVFFPFEQEIYARHHAVVTRVAHPALAEVAVPDFSAVSSDFFLFPGSRLPQARRNLPFFRALAGELCRLVPDARVVFVAARASLRADLEACLQQQFSVALAADFPRGFSGARGAVCPPGTTSLELALAGVPTLVTTVTDLPTYLLGRSRLRLPYLSLPNLLLGRALAKEAIFCRFPGLTPRPGTIRFLARELVHAPAHAWMDAARSLRDLLQAESLQTAALRHLRTWSYI